MVWESIWGPQSQGSGAGDDLRVSVSTQVPEDEEEGEDIYSSEWRRREQRSLKCPADAEKPWADTLATAFPPNTNIVLICLWQVFNDGGGDKTGPDWSNRQRLLRGLLLGETFHSFIRILF